MRVKNLMLFIHRGQKSLKTQYEINIFASKFHLGASWCPPGRVGAPWAYFGLQYCFKMGVLGSSWASIPSQDGPSSPSQGYQVRPKGVLGGFLGSSRASWGVLGLSWASIPSQDGRLGLILGFNTVSRWPKKLFIGLPSSLQGCLGATLWTFGKLLGLSTVADT